MTLPAFLALGCAMMGIAHAIQPQGIGQVGIHQGPRGMVHSGLVIPPAAPLPSPAPAWRDMPAEAAGDHGPASTTWQELPPVYEGHDGRPIVQPATIHLYDLPTIRP